MYSGEYVCDVTLSVYPHRASLKNMPGHGGNRTYDLWNTNPILLGFRNKSTYFDQKQRAFRHLGYTFDMHTSQVG
jgi:hypothetical protein